MKHWMWTGFTAAALLALLLVLGRSSSTAATSEAPVVWQMVGQVGGPTQAVAVQGNTAYVGVGLRLIALDVSNPITPTEVGSTTPFPYFVEDVVVSGTLAYVAAGGAGLRVVDVSTPTAPVEVGFWDSPGYAEGVAVAGDTVYLADGPYGLWTVDVSDPAYPLQVGSAYDMNYAFEAAVSDHHAYIAAAGAGLLVADVSDPAHPVEVDTLDTPGYAYGIAVSGTVAYVADGWEGLRLVDVSNPASPTEVSAYETPGWAFGVAISGTRAYVADAFKGLRVLDVSEVDQPQDLGGYDMFRGHAGSVAVAGSTAYVADRNWGLRIINVSDPGSLTEAGFFGSMGHAEGVDVAGDYAYVVASGAGLRVVDVSDPNHPRWVGASDIVFPNETYAKAVSVAGSYAYVGIANKLYVANISDPSHPFWTDSVLLVGTPRDMTIVGGIVYVADEAGLRLVSLADPAHPVLLGHIWLSTGAGGVCGVAVSGTLAYLTAEVDGFHIVDVSDPNNPTRVGGSFAFHPNDVAVSGNWAYLLEGSRLYIIDVSDPVQLQVASFIDTLGNGTRVTVSGSTAYIADGGRGLSVLDVSDPFHPTYITNVNTQGYGTAVTLANDRVFLADGQNGLVILEQVAMGNGSIEDINPGGQPTFALEVATGSVGPHSYAPAMGQIPLHIGPQLSPKPVQLGDPVREPGNEVARATSGVTTTCVVTSTADSGAGTLRGCLESAVSGDGITFDLTVFPPTHPVTITPSSALPAITQGDIIIDGSNAGVILDGSALSGDADGLRVFSDYNTIMGLQIYSFPNHGVFVQGDGNVIGGDRTQGDGPIGQGNVVSGNGYNGITISPGNNNIVVGNLLGTDVTGTRALGNAFQGVSIGAGSGNIIGRDDPRYRNILSGNWEHGAEMGGFASGNYIVGNYVGTDISGTADLGNLCYGIVIEGGAFNTVVQWNLVSGNRNVGIIVDGWGSDYNIIIGNLVGTDASGTKAIPNEMGVLVCAAFNRIGGTAPGEANLISGNSNLGVSVNADYTGNMVVGNLIGTTISGDAPLGNGVGILLLTYDVETMVGGATREEGNLISGNRHDGIDVEGDFNFIIGNRVGTSIGTDGSVPSNGDGVYLGGEHNLFQSNTVAHSLQGGHGVVVEKWSYNTIRRNSIYSNTGQGIYLVNGGNQMLPAPVILAVTETSVSGTACPDCTVEVFSDDEDEGRVYEGTTFATTTGAFTFTEPAGLTGPYVTATATDPNGNTSEFSAAHIVWRRVYLPVVLRGQ